MKKQNAVLVLLGLALALAALAGCAAPTPTPAPPTPVPPTATAVPPTATTAPTATAVPPTATKAPTVAPTNTATTAATPTAVPARPSNPGGPGSAVNLTGDAKNGAQVYVTNCQTCHGEQGKGGIKNPGSTDGTVPPLNPIDDTMVNKDSKVFATNVDLFIEHGSTPEGTNPTLKMPAWGDDKKLTPQQIADVIAYVISLNTGGAPSAGAAATPTEEMEMAKFYPKTAPSISAGAKVYAANCATCHGDKGDGKGPAGTALKPPPANFTDADFAHGDPPEDWYQSVTNGRPGTAMPAWQGKLSESDIWSVLFYVRRFATTPDKIAQGKTLYAANCVICHGDKGDGTGAAGTALKPPPANFTDRRMMSAHPSQKLFDTLTNGKGAMPAFKDKFTEEQRWGLVEYLWTFVYAP